MKEKVRAAIEQACVELYNIEGPVELERPEEQFGDFATNIAMRLAKELGKNPREIAQEIVNHLDQLDEIAEAGVAGPGFINVTLHDAELLEGISTDISPIFQGMKILVEYSDPNPFKPLHAGHLYTTLVGDAIARIVQHAGAQTVRLNYGGDVGMHAAKSMWAVVRTLGGEYPEKLADINPEERPQWLGARYVEGNSAYEDNEDQKAEITAVNKRIYQIHEADDKESGFAQIYWTCREWSYEFFKQLYTRLEVVAFDRFIPESEVTPLGLSTVNEQLEQGVFEHSDGAVIFDGKKYGLHTRVFINSEALPTYEAKDVGLSLTKWAEYQFDESIIITASEQAQYMQVVIKAIEQFAPDPAQRTKHLTHGVVKLQGGIKMSSRKGNTVTANDILEAATAAAQQSNTANSDGTMLAAVKYAFLKNKIGGDIAYDPAESIAMEGNSGPYLQYAHARARSILKKSETRSTKLETNSKLETYERSLARKLTEYVEVVEAASVELTPHIICGYLYELAQNFNRFYENSVVIGDEREALRLYLVQSYADTLKAGLELLGIQAPDSM